MTTLQRAPTGERFGSWTVLGPSTAPRGGHDGAKVRARCDCGTERDVTLRRVRIGKSQSCGCQRSTFAKERVARQRATYTRHVIAPSAAKGMGVHGEVWVSPIRLLGRVVIALSAGPMLATELAERCGAAEFDEAEAALLAMDCEAACVGDEGLLVYLRSEAYGVVRETIDAREWERTRRAA